MKPYSVLAKFYDELMFDVNYKERVDYLLKLFNKQNFSCKTIADLACGTGNITFELVKKGYEVIGIDFSEDMLTEAYQKSFEHGYSISNPLFVLQDMRKLDLVKPVSAITCVLDGINHLGSLKAVDETFKSVSLNLERDGLFVFDLNTPFKIKHVLGNNTFVYDYDDIYCVWENTYNEKSNSSKFDLTFFERDGEQYLRSDESFGEKAFTTRQIENRLIKNSLELIACYDDMSFDEPKDNSERIIYVARKV